MQIEVTVVVDANGEYGVGRDADTARQNYADDVGGLDECDGFRVLVLAVDVAPPEVVTLTGTAPSMGAATLTVKG
jgi:hypothetical protein